MKNTDNTTSPMYSLGYIQSYVQTTCASEQRDEAQEHLNNLEQFLKAYKQF